MKIYLNLIYSIGHRYLIETQVKILLKKIYQTYIMYLQYLRYATIYWGGKLSGYYIQFQQKYI